MLLRTLFTLILILVFNVFGLIFSSNYIEAYEIENFEKKIQSKIIPEYCAYMQLGIRSGPKGDMYKQILGKWWTATHHYCWGLDKIYLAHKYYDKRGFYLQSAIHEFDYVLKYVENPNSTFILKPEILTKKAVALALLGRDDEAIRVFWSAINVKPDYVYSYIQLSKLFSKNGIKDQAQKVLEIGLENSPDSSLLKQALAQLHMEK